MADAGNGVTCPHCGAANSDSAQFCAACGKAVGASGGPRIVAGSDLAGTAAGQALQGQELLENTKKARTALLTVAILQAVFGTLFTMVAAEGDFGAPGVAVSLTIVGVLSAVFLGLWVWSRNSPLPAAIVGLVLYGTLVAYNVVITLEAKSHGAPGTGLGGLGIGWLDIAIIAMLSQAIAAGQKHRQLLKARGER